MESILNEFYPDSGETDYVFGEVTSIEAVGVFIVTTVSGLAITINEEKGNYKEGDQIVLAKQNNDLNSVFILKTIDKLYPAAINLVIDNGTG